jgi:hypothetical protein
MPLLLLILTYIVLVICLCLDYANCSYYSILQHSQITYFLLNILCALCLSMHIKLILFMITNYFDNSQLIHSNWNNWYNSTTSPCHTPCCTVPSTLLAFITYSGTILMPTSWHPASVPGTRPAVGQGRTTSCICPRNPGGGRLALPERDWQAVLNGSGVSYWNYRQFSQDTFNGDDV